MSHPTWTIAEVIHRAQAMLRGSSLQCATAIGSSPIGRSDEAIISDPSRRNDKIDDPVLHVPNEGQSLPELSAITPSTAPEVAHAAPMAPGVGSFNIDPLAPRLGPVVDVAIEIPRSRWLVDPDHSWQLPIHTGRNPPQAWKSETTQQKAGKARAYTRRAMRAWRQANAHVRHGRHARAEYWLVRTLDIVEGGRSRRQRQRSRDTGYVLLCLCVLPLCLVWATVK